VEAEEQQLLFMMPLKPLLLQLELLLLSEVLLRLRLLELLLLLLAELEEELITREEMVHLEEEQEDLQQVREQEVLPLLDLGEGTPLQVGQLEQLGVEVLLNRELIGLQELRELKEETV
jgi:hypothetical protein